MERLHDFAASLFFDSKNDIPEDQENVEPQDTTDEPSPKRRRLNPSEPNDIPTDNNIDLSSTPMRN
jgi:hypothetical protein